MMRGLGSEERLGSCEGARAWLGKTTRLALERRGRLGSCDSARAWLGKTTRLALERRGRLGSCDGLTDQM
jgi:hypothetical protein